jgi:M6 family metalloprotease-like protein
LSDLSICKTSDITFRNNVSNGFPRPITARTGKIEVRVLFVPISFTDFPFTDLDLARNKSVTDRVRDFYTKTSYGNVTIKFEFLEKKYWVDMGRTAASYNLVENKPQQNNTKVVEDALSLVDAAINFDLYDGVVVESARFQSTGGGQGFPGQTFRTKTGQAKGVSFEFGTAVASFETLAHELGHSLFGLEDLYVFLNATRPSVPDPSPAGSWDMMSNSSQEYFGWSKFLNDWFAPKQVRCLVNQSATTHYLEDISIASEKPKLLLINLQAGVTIAVEVRLASARLGLLVYKIDSRIAHGDGPITAQKQLLSIDNHISIDGWKILAKDSDSKGVLVEITRS